MGGLVLLGGRPESLLEKVNQVVIHHSGKQSHCLDGDVLLTCFNQRKILLGQPSHRCNIRLLQIAFEASCFEVYSEYLLKFELGFLPGGT